jgi:hypothetical protein
MSAVLSTKNVLELSNDELLKKSNPAVRKELGFFLREFNKREWSVRIAGKYKSFDEYAAKGYKHQDRFGVGFVVNKQPVPYFHPNRSFHDEIIWLNNNLYYNDVSFNDKLVNSAIVKFYGPSRTLDIITGFAKDLPYLKKTDRPYINFDKLKDDDYAYKIMSNIETAYFHKEQIWGTTELRTSLQQASRDYARTSPTIVDKRGVVDPLTKSVIVEKTTDTSERKMRPSDMIHWIKYLSENGMTKFYGTKPTMDKSFEYLNTIRGIGNYYGYHFSSNLARMPGVGSKQLIEREWKEHFDKLGVTHGNLDENADYVVAGPGACATLKELFPDMPINQKTTMKMIIAIRDDQENFFGINTSEELQQLQEASELGRFTTFGCEISCCQFNVFTRLKDSPLLAAKRAKAPISKEVGNSKASDLSMFM